MGTVRHVVGSRGFVREARSQPSDRTSGALLRCGQRETRVEVGKRSVRQLGERAPYSVPGARRERWGADRGLSDGVPVAGRVSRGRRVGVSGGPAPRVSRREWPRPPPARRRRVQERPRRPTPPATATDSSRGPTPGRGAPRGRLVARGRRTGPRAGPAQAPRAPRARRRAAASAKARATDLRQRHRRARPPKGARGRGSDRRGGEEGGARVWVLSETSSDDKGCLERRFAEPQPPAPKASNLLFRTTSLPTKPLHNFTTDCL